MVLSSVTQFIAALMAIRLIRPSGVFVAWIFLACGFVIQGVRRVVALLNVLNGQDQGNLSVEALGLIISVLMLCGILKFRPLFEEINRTHAELVEKQAKLTKSNSELEAFVSTVSHDLRTPLAIIVGYAEHLQRNPGGNLDQGTLSCLKEIEKQGSRMAALMGDLLALAKVGYVDRPAIPADVGRVIGEVLAGFGPQLENQQVSVKVGDLPAVHLPETLLADVFENLLGNALRYGCKDGDVIELWGERSQDRVGFRVRDHGPGIPAEERERVFEMFYRGAAVKSMQGTGIGLAIVQKVAQLYGGRAWVEDSPGGGSTFCFEVRDLSA